MALGSFFLSTSITFLAISIWFNSNDFKPAEFSLPPPPPLTGQLAVNKPKVLDKLLEGQVVGAESIVVENKNTLYTCTTDGKCLKIVNGKIVKTIPLTNHKDCHAMTRQTISYCGRPLGIRRFNANEFIVVDCVLGFFVIDFEKETKELILSSSINVAGKPQKFPDDFDFADNDTIIYSDASTRFGYVDFLLAFLEHSGDGRIIKYKMSTGQLDVLVDGLNFPNGVQIHPDKQSVLFCESATARIHRHYFAGPKKGRNEIFFDNLPGFPDNIRISSSGKSFYVALFSHRNAEKPDFFQQTAGWPIARKIVGELLKILPQSAANLFFHQSHSSYGIVIELDLKGNILRSFHDPEGNVIKDISQISDDGDQFLYLASFANNYIGRMSKN